MAHVTPEKILQTGLAFWASKTLLSAVELGLFEENEATVSESAPDIEEALRKAAYAPMENTLRTSLTSVTLAHLAAEAEAFRADGGLMFYI